MKVRTFTREEIEQLSYECRNRLADDYNVIEFMMNWEGYDSIDNVDEWDDWTDFGSPTLDKELDCIFRYYESRMNYFRDNGYFDEI